MILSAQGISFLHAGDELLRSKVDEQGKVVFDSYESSDEVNRIRWDCLSQDRIQRLKEYYQGLIAFRKAHKGLRMNTASEIDEYMKFLDTGVENVVAFVVDGTEMEGEPAKKLLVAYNPNHESAELLLPEGTWGICVSGEQAGTEVIKHVEGKVTLNGISAYMLIQ